METTKTRTIAAAAKPLSGLIIYEDANAHIRALNMYLHLVVHLRREVPFQFSWWSFDELKSQTMLIKANEAVANADLVIISGKPTEQWPPELAAWLESWRSPQVKKLGAIGALLSPLNEVTVQNCGRQAFLQKIATRIGVDLLTANTMEQEDASQKSSIRRVASPLTVVAATKSPANISPYHGING